MRVKMMWPAALVMLLLTAAPAAHATFPGAPGMVVSGSGTNVNVDDPTDDRPPVSLAGEVGGPKFSADGTMVASTGPYGFKKALQVHSVTTGEMIWEYDFMVESPTKSRIPAAVAWAPDGTFYSFVYVVGDDVSELWRFDPKAGTGARVGSLPSLTNNRYRDPVISPDGTMLAARYHPTHGDPLQYIVTMSLTATDVREVPATRTTTSSGNAYTFDWRPDGNGYMYAHKGNGVPPQMRVYDKDGALLDEYVTSDSTDRAELARFTPDGGHTYRRACIENECGMVIRRIPDPDADVAPDEPVERLLPGAWPLASDWQSQRQPVVFIHGFAGAKLGCGSDETWLPTPFAVGADLLDMRLGPDGSSNLDGTCGVGATELLDRAFVVKDVYGSTRDWIEGLVPGHGHSFVWDWRKDPREVVPQLDAKLTEYLDTPEMNAQNVRRVAIIAHSMGGLVTRAYTDDAARANRVARAVTVGTPYNGAPKALFPLAFGTEMPGAGGDLDFLLPDSEFRAFAQTMTGLFFLMPSAKYGGWLSVAGRNPAPLDQPGVLSYADSLGANVAAFQRAMSAHEDELDGFKRNGVDLRVLLGTGRATIAGVAIEPAPDGDGYDVVVGYGDGDETVPATSASQGPALTANPDGENVSLMNVCGIGHMGLTANTRVQAPLEDFLVRGAPPRKTRQTCSVTGTELKFYGMERPDTTGAGRALARTSQAARTSEDVTGAQIIDLPNSFIALTQPDTPATVAGVGSGAYIAVTPIGDGTRGTPQYYGPITGDMQVQSSVGGGVTVLDDGAPVAGSSVRPSGLSDVGPSVATPAPTPEPNSTPAPTSETTPTPGAPSPAASPPVSPTTPGRAALHPPKRGLRVKRNRIAVPLRCVTGAACAGKLTVLKRTKRLGSASFTLTGGKSGTVKVKLRGVGKASLRRGLKVKLVVDHKGGGRSAKTTRLMPR